MFMEASSWKSSLAAYGMWIWEIFVLLWQGRHSNEFFLRLLILLSAQNLGKFTSPSFRS